MSSSSSTSPRRLSKAPRDCQKWSSDAVASIVGRLVTSHTAASDVPSTVDTVWARRRRTTKAGLPSTGGAQEGEATTAAGRQENCSSSTGITQRGGKCNNVEHFDRAPSR